MATTRFKFRASTVSGKQGTLYIQVIHQRVARQVCTKYQLYPDERDAAGQSVVVPKDTPPDRSRYLHAVQEALQRDTSRLQLIILALDHSRKEYHAEDVVKQFNSTDEFSRNTFLFSLYTCGMSLTDIAHLKKSDLQGDYLSYCRQKTGQRITIRWEPCMQQLVDKYKNDDSPYLLPIITRPGKTRKGNTRT